MSRFRIISIVLGLVLMSTPVWSTCVVESASSSADTVGSLAALLARVQRGECYTESAELATLYKPYLQMARGFHVIEWRQSMDLLLTQPLPPVQGYEKNPLILRAAPGVQVRIIGQQLAASASITISDGSAPVILDGLTISGFPGIAVDIVSDDAALLHTRVLASGAAVDTTDPMAMIPGIRTRGRRTHIVESEVAHHRGPGVVMTEDARLASCATTMHRQGERAQIVSSEIHHNGGDGIVINAFDARVQSSRVSDNAGHGVFVRSASIAADCAAQRGEAISPTLWHTALITETTFWQNGGEAHAAIAVSGDPLPPPVDLVVVSPETAVDLTLIGNLSRFDDAAHVWNDAVLNFDALQVEIFLSDGSATGEGRHFLTTIAHIDPATRQFVAHLPRSTLLVNGQQIDHPVFVATIVDHEIRNTSPFSLPLAVQATYDWDDDGLLNAEEDRNHDGVVDATETNPRLADSDGDGLVDGAEVLRLGYVADATQIDNADLRVVLASPQDLDPRNPDSDGDCLPDGLEMRMREAALPLWHPTPGSVLQRVRVEFSSACLQQFRERNVLLLEHAIPWDPTQAKSPDNVTALHDTDPDTWTDPTSADTDDDGVQDGAEDWNIDGMRTVQAPAQIGVETLMAATPHWLETDPRLRDSDADGLADGAEGDRDGDDRLSDTETDALRADTDGDGLPDAEEAQQFGTKPNACDSDHDGLPDGLEAGRINPYPDIETCRGLQADGSNFASIEALDPLKIDSDNDGVPDGDEDSNHNGWLDATESDPTTPDTDGDGINDAIERTGDVDGDGISDIALADLDHGAKCAPPPDVADLDCDGLPNARDDDSDNDGCSDKSEGLAGDFDPQGISAAFTAAVKGCDKGSGGSGGGGGTAAPPVAPAEAVDPDVELRDYYSRQIKGGGGCSLVARDS